MSKKFLFSLVLCLLLLPALAFGFQCKINANSKVLLAEPNGIVPAMTSREVPADIDAEQPSIEILQKISQALNNDWTDGVSVTDENEYRVLVHKNDLKCN